MAKSIRCRMDMYVYSSGVARPDNARAMDDIEGCFCEPEYADHGFHQHSSEENMRVRVRTGRSRRCVAYEEDSRRRSTEDYSHDQ